MPKILFFANTDWYLYNFRLALARSLKERGVEVVMVSPPGSYGPKLVAEGFRWVSIPMDRRSVNPLEEVKVVRQLVSLYKAERPDLVHHFTIKSVVYGSLAARIASTEAVVNAVAGLGHVFTDKNIRSKLLRPVVATLLRFCFVGQKGRLIVQNPEDCEMFTKRHLIKARKIRLIRGSGVNIDRFQPKQRLKRGGRALRVLLATRLLWAKGVGEYVEAARVLKRENDGVEFLIAGNPDPGNPAAVPLETIEGWRQEGAVTMLGHVNKMAELLPDMDLVVLPSSYGEGVPRILLEAAACGVPLVATDAPGCREIVAHGLNGLLVPCKDSTALAAAIRHLLERPEERARMGEAGRAKVLEEFDERIVIRKTLEVYRELLPKWQYAESLGDVCAVTE